jgi:HD-like signal output (HDOD) protein
MTATATPLDAILAKTGGLYSLPAVAMDVLRLTSQPNVDTRALKECIERDPALTVKLLRVVNSSLFGLSSKVENLTQAIALLGIKPLKLLVLGFSLPEQLLDGLEEKTLTSYWRGALTRAVAARQLAEQMFGVPGDDPFLAALLQDVGKLVLLQQVGTPYALFTLQVRLEGHDLALLERKSLGFDHRQLSAALLGQWKLPPFYIEVIQQSAEEETPPGKLSTTAKIVRLANLLADLVDGHRLAVLPELLERGEAWCQLTREGLHELVTELEPQVAQLADILQVDVGGTEEFARLLHQAHAQLAGVAEEVTIEMLAAEEPPYGPLLAESQQLANSVRTFVEESASPSPPAPTNEREACRPSRSLRERFIEQLATTVGSCRANRRGLSLLLLAGVSQQEGDDKGPPRIKRLALQLCERHGLPASSMTPLGQGQCALVLPGHERHETVRLAQEFVAEPLLWEHRVDELKIGIASLALVPKGYDTQRLLTAAEGCLNAARASGGSVVKSIEVY